MFTVFTPFFTLGPTSTTLYSTNTLCHGLISSTTFLQHSTTLYNTLQSTALQHFYSLQPLQHPSALGPCHGPWSERRQWMVGRASGAFFASVHVCNSCRYNKPTGVASAMRHRTNTEALLRPPSTSMPRSCAAPIEAATGPCQKRKTRARGSPRAPGAAVAAHGRRAMDGHGKGWR